MVVLHTGINKQTADNRVRLDKLQLQASFLLKIEIDATKNQHVSLKHSQFVYHPFGQLYYFH